MKKNEGRFVHAIFCDDMRQELGNKVSFMGCYQSELFVPAVPIMLAKLCAHVTVSTVAKRPLKALTVRLDQGSNQVAVVEIPSDDLARAVPPAPEDATPMAASVVIMLSPFTITEPGELRVVAITEEGEIVGPRLRIKVMPQADAVAEPAEPAEPVAASAAIRKAAPKKAAARGAPAKKAK